MLSYPIGDYLIQIKNAARAKNREISSKSSRLIAAVAVELKKMGILESFVVKDGIITSRLAYHKKEPMLIDLKIVSKPGLRKYLDVDGLKSRKRRNASRLVLSTPLGVMSSTEALKKNTGGEVIVEIW